MTEDSPAPSRLAAVAASTGLGALIVGGAGFAAGFLGPIAFNPDANQGPLLGILITGPGGAVMGAALGLVLGASGVPRRAALITYITTAAALALGTLYFSLPQPQRLTSLIAYEVVNCEPPAALKEQAFADWDKRVAAVTWSPPRAGWKEGFEGMVAADPGVVVTVKVTHAEDVYQNRKPWNRTMFAVHVPEKSGAKYFLRKSSCAEQTPGKTGTATARGENSGGWPSTNLSNFLDLTVLEPIPAELRGFLP